MSYSDKKGESAQAIMKITPAIARIIPPTLTESGVSGSFHIDGSVAPVLLLRQLQSGI